MDTLRSEYYLSEDPSKRAIYVEESNFVQNCIRKGVYEHKLPAKKGMGGIPGGGGPRTQFTPEDDHHLCHYLSLKIPVKEAGGRTGNNIYKDLENIGRVVKEYSWVRRHSWQSWRERYKKNWFRLDPLIDELVMANEGGKKQEHILDRRYRRGAQIQHKALLDEFDTEESQSESDETHVESEDHDELEEEFQHNIETPMRKRPRPGSHHSPRIRRSPTKRQRVHKDSRQRRDVNAEHEHGHDGPISKPSHARLRERGAGMGKGKGKGRASPPPSIRNESPNVTDDFDPLFDSYSDLDKPGPSGTQRTPSPSLPPPDSTMANREDNFLFSSQVTLVAATPAPDLVLTQRKQNKPLGDSHTQPMTTVPLVPIPEAPTPQPASSSRLELQNHSRSNADPDTRQMLVHDIPASLSRVLRPRPVLPTSINKGQVPTKSEPKQSQMAEKVAPRRRTKLAPTTTAGVSAPYRNTRSGSRSVEPSASNTRRAGVKGKGSREKAKILQPLVEDAGGRESHESDAEMKIEMTDTADASPSRILAEERDVENLLTLGGNNQSGVTHLSDVSDQEDDAQPRSEHRTSQEESLETDDEQIHNSLQSHVHPLPRTVSRQNIFANLTPSDVASMITSSRWNIPAPIGSPSQASHPALTPRSPTRDASRPSGSFNVGPNSNNTASTHPLPSFGLARPIPMADLTFPSPGTRAREMKDNLEQLGKLSPYKPLAGTRASRHPVAR